VLRRGYAPAFFVSRLNLGVGEGNRHRIIFWGYGTYVRAEFIFSVSAKLLTLGCVSSFDGKELMNTQQQPDDPFPRGDEIWSALGRIEREVEVASERTDCLVRSVMEVVESESRVVVRGRFRASVMWGAVVGIAAALVVSASALFFASSRGVNAEVNALADLAEVHGIDLGGGDQFLIAHLDELLETDVHALWLESTVR
jgi:hypothetical protein